MKIFTENRSCPSHLLLNEKRLYEEDLRLTPVHSYFSEIKLTEFTRFFESLSARVDNELIDKIPENRLDERRLKVFTGLSWQKLHTIHDMIITLRNSIGRDIGQTLVVFLLKLLSGDFNSIVASILGIL